VRELGGKIESESLILGTILGLREFSFIYTEMKVIYIQGY
jgi:hypothetical protein